MKTQEQKTEDIIKTKSTTKTEHNTKIIKDTPISEILKKFPEAAEILMEYGLMCADCPLAGKHNLETTKNIYGFSNEDIEEILAKINKLAENETD